MLAVQRREAIKDILLAQKSATVAGLSSQFSVSAETIRRDLDALCKEGFLDKSYGGAVLRTRVANTVSQKVKSGIMVDSKRRIAKRAAGFIHPNDCIFLDDSTTTYELCREIGDMPLTVMSNSIDVLNFFVQSPNVRVICPGGNLDRDTRGYFGMDTLEFVQKRYLDKAFFSCRSLDKRYGLCSTTENSASLRRAIIKQATTTYLLADHTKFNKPSFIRIGGFEHLDYLLTDQPLSADWRVFLQEQSVALVECLE